MKENKMVEAIGKVDDKYLNEAINFKPKKKKMYAGVMKFAAAAACLCLVLGMGIFRSANKVDSVVSIDINPSIEITVSKHDKVLSAVALNADAQKVLEGMNLKNVDLDTAMNAIIGSLLKNGYLDEVYNAVNVCIENNDEERAGELGEKLENEISGLFDEKDLIGGVNTQFCSTSEEAKKLAESYGISVGKLGLAQKVSANTGLSLDETVKLSISELWDLLDAQSANLITKDAALEIAVADAKVEASEITLVSVKIQETSGVFTYIIKFTAGEHMMYKYEINAVAGTVLESEYQYISNEENSDDENEEDGTVSSGDAGDTSGTVSSGDADDDAEKEEKPLPPAPVKQITKKEALRIAYNDAGVEEKDAKLEELKHKPKEKEYHIEFSVGLCDYVYVINAVDGSIVRKEVFDKTNIDDSGEEISPESIISVERALEIALNKAGVEFAALTKCDIKYTNKKVSAEYKVHFHVDKDHYEYIVDAVTGECVEKTHPTPGAPVPPHEKEEPKKPTPKPHEKPLGPEDTKITISFEEANN